MRPGGLSRTSYLRAKLLCSDPRGGGGGSYGIDRDKLDTHELPHVKHRQ